MPVIIHAEPNERDMQLLYETGRIARQAKTKLWGP
jgi:hypothetical protein